MNDEKHPNQVALEELRALLYRNSQRFCGGESFPVTQEMIEAEREYLDGIEAERRKPPPRKRRRRRR